MNPVDVEALRAWYRKALGERARELAELRPGVRAGDLDAAETARAVGCVLRSSGSSYGFLEVTDAGALLEEAGEPDLARRVDATERLLLRLAGGEEATPDRRWILRAAGLEGSPPGDLPDGDEGAWTWVAERAGIDATGLARRVADHYGLEAIPIEARPERAALRLVPEALARRLRVVPLREDGDLLHVATPDPLDVEVELELARVSGRETRFVVAPPGAVSRALSAQERAARDPEPTGSGSDGDAPGGGCVLVVDDDPGARLVARAALEREGFEVLEAGDGIEALERLALGGIDLMVVDLDMPRMGGRDFLRALRTGQAASATPVVVVTGAEDPSVEAELFEQGADDYVRKPFDPRSFLARVRATLRRSRA